MERVLLIAAIVAFAVAVVLAGACIALFAHEDVVGAIGYLRRRGRRRARSRNRSSGERSEFPTRSLADRKSVV